MRTLFALAVQAALVAALGPYNVDPNGITVGGLSAGAFAAAQMQVTYSDIISGNAMFVGGPYYCSQGQLSIAETECMYAIGGSVPNPGYLRDLTLNAENEGSIANVSNLASHKLFVYSGALDTVVATAVVKDTVAYFEQFIDTSSGGSILGVFDVESEHMYPTLKNGEPCNQLADPYIGKCDYDGAGISLRALYGDLSPPVAAVSDNLLAFDQTQFATGNSLGDTGYIYVPTACKNGSVACKLHMQLHGCQQTLADIGTQYVEEIGLNEYGEANNIIVIYPQVSRSDLFPSNPEGCFDWWGYTNGNFANNKGPQMLFLRALLHAVAQI
jgi:hypothetical protein